MAPLAFSVGPRSARNLSKLGYDGSELRTVPLRKVSRFDSLVNLR